MFPALVRWFISAITHEHVARHSLGSLTMIWSKLSLLLLVLSWDSQAFMWRLRRASRAFSFNVGMEIEFLRMPARFESSTLLISEANGPGLSRFSMLSSDSLSSLASFPVRYILSWTLRRGLKFTSSWNDSLLLMLSLDRQTSLLFKFVFSSSANGMLALLFSPLIVLCKLMFKSFRCFADDIFAQSL